LHFNGKLTVPVFVSKGDTVSGDFSLSVSVTSVNDIPAITGQKSLSAFVGFTFNQEET
jgi:hypothetical protein